MVKKILSLGGPTLKNQKKNKLLIFQSQIYHLRDMEPFFKDPHSLYYSIFKIERSYETMLTRLLFYLDLLTQSILKRIDLSFTAA